MYTSKEAANILGVTKRQLSRYMKDGLIQPVREPGGSLNPNENKFDENDIYALKKVKGQKLTLEKIAVMAQKSYLQSRQHTRLLDWMMSALGCGGSFLSLEEDAVDALHAKVERELERSTFLYSTDEVFEWARTFHLMGEEYMEAVALFLDTERPWQIYSKLAATMLQHRPAEGDPELLAAYNCLDISRRDLRRAGFLYAYDNFGKHIAYALFPESKGDFHQKVLSSILMHDKARKEFTLDKRSPRSRGT